MATNQMFQFMSHLLRLCDSNNYIYKQVDVLPSKNQVLSKYYTHLSKFKRC